MLGISTSVLEVVSGETAIAEKAGVNGYLHVQVGEQLAQFVFLGFVVDVANVYSIRNLWFGGHGGEGVWVEWWLSTVEFLVSTGGSQHGVTATRGGCFELKTSPMASDLSVEKNIMNDTYRGLDPLPVVIIMFCGWEAIYEYLLKYEVVE